MVELGPNTSTYTVYPFLFLRKHNTYCVHPFNIITVLHIYFTYFFVLVPLASIPELPAESCKEMKASEGGQAVSGNYWFDSIVPGKVILAHCDVETEGDTAYLT